MGGEYRKSINIEAFLRWAYRDELPKVKVALDDAGSPSFRFSELGGRIEDWSNDPGFPAILGTPHPDALMVEAAVNRLEDVGLDWSNSRTHLMGDLAAWIPANDPIMTYTSLQPSGLVSMHAKMGTRPAWNIGAIRVIRVLGPNGKPKVQRLDDDGTLVDGRTEGRHYGEMARCPLQLDPPPREIARARAEYSAWWNAIRHLTMVFRAWNLVEHRVEETLAAPQPWLIDNEPKPNILPRIHTKHSLLQAAI